MNNWIKLMLVFFALQVFSVPAFAADEEQSEEEVLVPAPEEESE